MSVPRAVALLLISVYLLFLLDLAWLQFPSHYPQPNVVPFRSMISDWRTGGREWLVNFLGNIVAFIPIGMMPGLARPRSGRVQHAAVFSLALSAMIEVVQYGSGRRVADVDDLILNTAGGVLGYGLLWLALGRRDRTAAAKSGGPAGNLVEGPGGRL